MAEQLYPTELIEKMKKHYDGRPEDLGMTQIPIWLIRELLRQYLDLRKNLEREQQHLQQIITEIEEARPTLENLLEFLLQQETPNKKKKGKQ